VPEEVKFTMKGLLPSLETLHRVQHSPVNRECHNKVYGLEVFSAFESQRERSDDGNRRGWRENGQCGALAIHRLALRSIPKSEYNGYNRYMARLGNSEKTPNHVFC